MMSQEWIVTWWILGFCLVEALCMWGLFRWVFPWLDRRLDAQSVAMFYASAKAFDDFDAMLARQGDRCEVNFTASESGCNQPDLRAGEKRKMPFRRMIDEGSNRWAQREQEKKK